MNDAYQPPRSSLSSRKRPQTARSIHAWATAAFDAANHDSSVEPAPSPLVGPRARAKSLNHNLSTRADQVRGSTSTRTRALRSRRHAECERETESKMRRTLPGGRLSAAFEVLRPAGYRRATTMNTFNHSFILSFENASLNNDELIKDSYNIDALMMHRGTYRGHMVSVCHAS